MQEQLRFIKRGGIHQSEVVFAATGYIRADITTAQVWRHGLCDRARSGTEVRTRHKSLSQTTGTA